MVRCGRLLVASASLPPRARVRPRWRRRAERLHRRFPLGAAALAAAAANLRRSA